MISNQTYGRPLERALDKSLEELGKDAGDGIIAKVLVETARKAIEDNDTKAQMWLLNRTFAPPKSHITPLPGLELCMSLSEQSSFVIAAAAEGRISLEEANQYMAMVDKHARIIEVHELVEKMNVIEGHLEERGLLGVDK